MKYIKTYESKQSEYEEVEYLLKNKKIDVNENFNLYINYEIRGLDSNGDEYIPVYDENDAKYNPYDLKDMVKLLMEKQKSDPKLYLVKITTEKIPDDSLEKIMKEIKTDKYKL